MSDKELMSLGSATYLWTTIGYLWKEICVACIACDLLHRIFALCNRQSEPCLLYDPLALLTS